ncbi:MAG: 4-(cytidine 5'-diphospho)-2-C-methyl-D-erythritol kinase [Gemmatimonadaceae bacterium]|nr:4-(cytidine 5'-diphospho)-2-C-methyl-D-erythritol kinase [Gemmatimonadaceae bacterium]
MPDTTARYAEVEAWAKVNLDLRILAREASGYHQLETVFQRISLADDVKVLVREGEGIAIRCTPPVDVPDHENLACRAAAAYRAAAAWPAPGQRIVIAITKRIPTGGGLGGGSADAGAVLRALNALNREPLDTATLLTIAASLGADVPFLSTEAACTLAWGRGERLLPLAPLPARTVHMATFDTGVNTALAYHALATARSDGRITPPGGMLLGAGTLDSWHALQRHARNDFEGPVFALRPDIAAVHAAWSAVAPQALVRMSGSGATVVAITDVQPDAYAAVAATWPARDGTRYQRAQTLTAVPPVRILSPPIGFR